MAILFISLKVIDMRLLCVLLMMVQKSVTLFLLDLFRCYRIRIIINNLYKMVSQILH